MGPPIGYEPSNLDALSVNRVVEDIFQKVGWIGYFQRLNGFHEETTFQFSMNMNGEYSVITGLRVDASEWAIAEAKRLPQIGNHWFFRKRHNLTAVE